MGKTEEVVEMGTWTRQGFSVEGGQRQDQEWHFIHGLPLWAATPACWIRADITSQSSLVIGKPRHGLRVFLSIAFA